LNKNYYKILELEPGCSVSDIKDAYRRLAKKYHPDLNKSPQAHQLFIEINEAYEILMERQLRTSSQPEKTEYDENYEEFIRKVREAAQKRAKMRYEKFVKEHEAFRESGLYDLVLALKYIGWAVLPVIAFMLIFMPILIAIANKEFAIIFYLFYFWVIGFILLFIIFLNRKDYFKLGKFYYSIDKVKEIFRNLKKSADKDCFYCKGLKADSVPFKIAFYKVTSINLKNEGPLQHYAGYNRNIIKEIMPRSQKAFLVHIIVSAIKISCIVFSLIFLNINSLLWRAIIGFFIAWPVSSVILLVTNTKSKVGYLLSWGMILKIAIWLGVISLASRFTSQPFNIYTSEYIQFLLVIMFFGDAFLEQLIKLPMKMKIFKPLLPSYKKLNHFYEENNFLYLEIPIWTALYPIIRWIF
jgi:hypothetical protein